MQKRLKIIYSSVIAAIFSVLFITVSTIGGELYKPFKGWLKDAFFHHWIGKGVLAVIIFLVLWLVLSFFYSRRVPVNIENKTTNALLTLFWITVLSILALTAFFVLHFLKIL